MSSNADASSKLRGTLALVMKTKGLTTNLKKNAGRWANLMKHLGV